MERPIMHLSATVLGAPEPRVLGGFYADLLGWTVVTSEPVWVMLRAPSGGPGLSFQYEPNFVRPVWPAAAGEQQMTSHLDIAVNDLDAGVAWACELGATLADHQPQPHVRVMLDPAGHPFCLFARPSEETGIMGHNATVDVVAAAFNDKPVLRSLLELYQYDLSRFDKRVIGPSGQYGYRYLDHYWTDDERHSYLVRIDGQCAGFALVNRHSPLGEQVWSVAEFFVMAAYRRNGYGESVAHWLFDQHAGPWHVAVEARNIAGQRFWRTVVERYTNSRFDELQVDDDRWQGPVLIFDNGQSR